MLHQSPRTFGQESSLWTLEMAAGVSFEEGLTEERVSGETIRATLARMGVGWRRAKRWITSPGPRSTKEKRPRERLIGLSELNDDWVLGFEDEVWWSRLALPSLHGFSEKGKPLRRLVEHSLAKETIPIRRPSLVTGCSCRSSTRRGCASWTAAR